MGKYCNPVEFFPFNPIIMHTPFGGKRSCLSKHPEIVPLNVKIHYDLHANCKQLSAWSLIFSRFDLRKLKSTSQRAPPLGRGGAYSIYSALSTKVSRCECALLSVAVVFTQVSLSRPRVLGHSGYAPRLADFVYLCAINTSFSFNFLLTLRKWIFRFACQSVFRQMAPSVATTRADHFIY